MSRVLIEGTNIVIRILPETPRLYVRATITVGRIIVAGVIGMQGITINDGQQLQVGIATQVVDAAGNPAVDGSGNPIPALNIGDVSFAIDLPAVATLIDGATLNASSTPPGPFLGFVVVPVSTPNELGVATVTVQGVRADVASLTEKYAVTVTAGAPAGFGFVATVTPKA